jgi:hypothetical protein
VCRVVVIVVSVVGQTFGAASKQTKLGKIIAKKRRILLSTIIFLLLLLLINLVVLVFIDGNVEYAEL